MGPYILVNAAFVGFFFSLSFVFIWHWWLSRREYCFWVFSANCLLCAALCVCLIQLATTQSIEVSSLALRWRITIALCCLSTSIWSIAWLADLHTTRYVQSVIFFLLVAATINLFLMPLHGKIIAVTSVVLPWGEHVSYPVRLRGNWFQFPVYAVVTSLYVFIFYAAVRLWRRDRAVSILLAALNFTWIASHLTSLFADVGHRPLPYIGVLPSVFLASILAFVTARQYAIRGKQLAASERHLRAIFDQSYQFMGLMTVEGRLIESNHSALEFLGINDQDVIGKFLWQTPWWTHSVEIQDKLQQAVRAAAQGQSLRFQATYPSRDVGLRSVDLSVKPVLDETGVINLLIAEARDITELKRSEVTLQNSEASLRQRESQLRRLVDSNMIGIFFWQEDGYLIDANDYFLQLIGLRREELLRHEIRWLDLVPDEYLPLRAKAQAEVAEMGKCTPFEKEYIRKDGRRVPVLVGAAKFDDAADRGVAFVLDLTKSKELEQQLRHAQKMQAIGQLAGGVAHDFNNLLTVILSCGYDLLESLTASDERVPTIQSILDAGNRAASLTQRLLSFGRRAILRPRIVDMNDVILDIANLLVRLIGEDVALITELDPSECLVFVDQHQIGQVLVNLAVNARDAMPNGGKLIIETRRIKTPHPDPAIPDRFTPEESIQLIVKDTGCGMLPEISAHIFEPFFTTKETGKGTGLGLATVHGIVMQSGGTIEFQTEPDVGTEFQLNFPASEHKTESNEGFDSNTGSLDGTETILLVEDDEQLLKLTFTELQNRGYRVLTAKNGKQAVSFADSFVDEIHLLVTDVVMPGISGREVADVLRAKRPRIKTLFISGYTNDDVLRRGVSQEKVSFLQKPFKLDFLAKTVRNLLNGE